ncbi:hypothetical protein ABZX90_38565 [Streptomyces sp. NPDC002935]|uniref:hypothetical protein n=1 Tax=Streptomyces sp. NPDC002935 TaxID=3154545 RepID=UPI0033A29623
MQVLQALFDAAHKHGTEVHLAPVAVPEGWAGPVFARTAEIATLLEAQADQERPLGQLHLA